MLALLKKFILWIFLNQPLPGSSNNMLPKTKPFLLFELGNLQVFHYPTQDQITRGLLPTEVYWQDKSSRHTYGPFPGIHAAMSHYTWVIATQKTGSKGNVGNVIYMNFKTKKRVVISNEQK